MHHGLHGSVHLARAAAHPLRNQTAPTLTQSREGAPPFRRSACLARCHLIEPRSVGRWERQLRAAHLLGAARCMAIDPVFDYGFSTWCLGCGHEPI